LWLIFDYLCYIGVFYLNNCLGKRESIDEESDRLEVEDLESVTSAGTGSINGTWWFGRDTRFVPHCQKRHLHGAEGT